MLQTECFATTSEGLATAANTTVFESVIAVLKRREVAVGNVADLVSTVVVLKPGPV